MSLCNHCDEQELCIFPCLESLEEVKEVERMPSKPYKPHEPKEMVLLNYKETRTIKKYETLNFK